MKVVIARPGEKAVVGEVKNGFEDLERTVGGRLGFFPSPVSGTVVICDKRGAEKGKMPNRYVFGILARLFPEREKDIDVLAGTIVIAGKEGNRLASLTEEKAKVVMEIYKYPVCCREDLY